MILFSAHCNTGNTVQVKEEKQDKGKSHFVAAIVGLDIFIVIVCPNKVKLATSSGYKTT